MYLDLRGFKMKKVIALILAVITVSASVCCSARANKTPESIITLPAPKTNGNISLEQAIQSRRSIRDFTDEKADMQKISQLLWAGQGITDEETGFRAAPSAGAIYPLQLHLVTEDGLYIYDPAANSLTRTLSRDIRSMLFTASYRQQVVRNAPQSIIISGRPRKAEMKYRNKGRQFTILEAGHVAQNLLLQATTLGLGAVPIGAFDTKTVARICNFEKFQEPFYIICFGEPAGGIELLPIAEKRVRDKTPTTPAKPLKAVLVISAERFFDDELFDIEDVLEIAEVEIDIASIRTGQLDGAGGKSIMADLLVQDVNTDDYDAFIFLADIGSELYYNNRAILNLARTANEKNKIVAAINTTPLIFANAGILRDKNVTSYVTKRKLLTEAGANWTRDLDIVIDGNMITAQKPDDATRFARAILRSLRRLR